jgi:hypothetical protein
MFYNLYYDKIGSADYKTKNKTKTTKINTLDSILFHSTTSPSIRTQTHPTTMDHVHIGGYAAFMPQTGGAEWAFQSKPTLTTNLSNA